eukprot:6476337-Amphidinium_carterae.1
MDAVLLRGATPALSENWAGPGWHVWQHCEANALSSDAGYQELTETTWLFHHSHFLGKSLGWPALNIHTEPQKVWSDEVGLS